MVGIHIRWKEGAISMAGLLYDDLYNPDIWGL